MKLKFLAALALSAVLLLSGCAAPAARRRPKASTASRVQIFFPSLLMQNSPSQSFP